MKLLFVFEDQHLAEMWFVNRATKAAWYCSAGPLDDVQQARNGFILKY